jgi:hypothetical protein
MRTHPNTGEQIRHKTSYEDLPAAVLAVNRGRECLFVVA